MTWVEILCQGVKKLAPEEVARKIQHFDQDLCTQTFLSELKPLLPTPEQIGKLNIYKNASIEDLAELHTADRLMVQLIQIDRLAPRVEGMLYKVAFSERWGLLDDVGGHLFFPLLPFVYNDYRAPRNFWTRDIPYYMLSTLKSSSVLVFPLVSSVVV